ncbi:hypothetical protein FRC20_005312 [Serendipita sp. 405]|nr:hypothetical protein FRC20_005312 [Serendipita sp. 405]
MPFVPSPPEVAIVNQIFAIADPQKLGIITGEQGVKVFAGCNLPPATLGDIWSLSDPENNGILTRKGVAIAVRLIGWAQKGESPSAELLEKPGPLPTIEGIPTPPAAPLPSRAPLAPIVALAHSLPPLSPTDRSKFLTLFSKANPVGGLLSGEQARNIFVRSKLSLERLNAIWSLVDVANRGSLDATQFVLAMYFIQGSMSNPQTIPILPPSVPSFLWDQAGGRPPSVHSHTTGESLPSPTSGFKPFTPQFTGGSSIASFQMQPQSTGTPMASQITGSRVYPSIPARPSNLSLTSQLTGSPFPLARPSAVVQLPWDITTEEKAKSDTFFDSLDASHSGFIDGATAVPFMLLSQLPEDVLARVWDLSDMKNDGQLTKDTFAVALHLINTVLEGKELPAVLPPTLIPPSMRGSITSSSQVAPTSSMLSEAHRDLLSLDDVVITPQPTTSPPPRNAQISPVPTGVSTAPVIIPPVAASPAPKPVRSAIGRDLLDDEEAEERQHKQLSDNSVEIANLRNQLASTTSAQVTAQDERAKLEADLATSAVTLSQLKTQLASAKVGFDTETKLLAGLRDRYNAQAQELQTTRDELIRAESDLSALKLEKAEIGGNLLREKDDVRDLKRHLAEVTEETATIKREIEQAKKDARHQKGMLAIARKQLTSAEADRDAALKERDEAREEVTATEAEITQVEKSIVDLKASTPVPNGDTLANGVPPTSFSASVDAKVGMGSPSASSPALPYADVSNIASPAPSSKSNNPFDRLRKGSVASENSAQFRTASPFAATSPVAEAKVIDDDDPFGFNEMQPTPPAGKETMVGTGDTPRTSSQMAGETLNQPTSEGKDNLLSPSDTFFTPPTSSASNTAEPNTIDSLFDSNEDTSASNRFPSLTSPAEAELPPLQEKEQDSSSDSDEDDRPLGEIKAENAAVTSTINEVVPATNQATSTTFEDVFDFSAPDPNRSVPATAPSSQFSTLGSEQMMSSSAVSTNPPTHQSVTNGLATGSTTVSAFDEAMGLVPSAQAPVGDVEPFKFDRFDDTFNFEESSFSHTRNQSAEVAMPPPNMSAPASAAFDEAFGLAPSSTIVAPNPVVTAPLSFDDAFEVSTNGPSTSSQQNQVNTLPAPGPLNNAPTVTIPPADNVPSAASVTAPSPTTTRISSSSVRAASPTPRASSPKLPAARPRPAKDTSAQKASGGLNPEPSTPSRSSRLSLHFPFGRSKTTKEKKEKKDKHAKDHARDEHVGMPPIPAIPSEYSTERLETPELSTPGEDGDLPALKQLMEYGFSRQEAVDALEATGYSFQRALNKLLKA